MANPRHTGRTGPNYDKKFEFASPDSRAADRSASHRYFPFDPDASPRTDSGAKRAQDHFTAQDFKARWWPAPDLFQ